MFGKDGSVTGVNVGTDFNEKGDTEPYSASGFRTVLVAPVWGYNTNDTSLVSQALDPHPVSLSGVIGQRGVAEGARDPSESKASHLAYSAWGFLSFVVVLLALL